MHESEWKKRKNRIVKHLEGVNPACEIISLFVNGRLLDFHTGHALTERFARIPDKKTSRNVESRCIFSTLRYWNL